MNEVRLDPQQAPARAELLLAANFGREARGRPIYVCLESEDGGAGEPGPRLKIGAVRTRRLAASEGTDRPSGSVYGNPLRGTRDNAPAVPIGAPVIVRTDIPGRPRVARLPGGAERGRHLRRVDRARPGQRGAGRRRAARGRGDEPRGGAATRRREAARPRERGSDHAVARRPGDRAAEIPGEAPVAGRPAAVAARPRAERRPRMTRLTKRDPPGSPTPCTGTPRTTPPSRPA